MSVDRVRLQFGWYLHPQGTATYTLQRNTIFNNKKTPVAENVTVQIIGRISADDHITLQQRWVELEAAYSQTGPVDFNVTINGTQSVFGINGSSAIGGVRVTQKPSIPQTMGNAHIKYLNFTVEIQAMVPYVGAGFVLTSFRESLSFEGGGPRTAMIESLWGPPVKQQTRAATIYRCTQSGTSVGLLGKPSIPAPLFPSDWTGDYGANRDSGDRFGVFETNNTATWRYQFESAIPYATGFPNSDGNVLL